MQALPRLLALVFAAFYLAAAVAPCPSAVFGLSGGAGDPEGPVAERLCPCGCEAGPAVVVAGAYVAPPPATQLPVLPPLRHERRPAAAILPWAPADPIDHVPLGA